LAVLIGWVVVAWLGNRGPAETPSETGPSRSRLSLLPPALPAAFNPVDGQGHLDCAAYIRPLLNSLRALQGTTGTGLDRRSYGAQVATAMPVYRRTNFGALGGRCAVDVATPAVAAWSQYVRGRNAWLRCGRLGCNPRTLTRLLVRHWAMARGELERAARALHDLERQRPPAGKAATASLNPSERPWQL